MAHPARARDTAPEEVAARTSPDSPARPPSQKRAAKIQSQALVAVAVVVSIGALKVAQGFFVPVVFGIVIALALGPIVRRLGRIMPRWIASALVVFALAGVLGFMAYSLGDEASQAVAGLPRATRALRQTFRTLISQGEGALSQLQRAAHELQKTATESTDRPTTPSGVTPVQVVEPPVDFSNFVWLGSQGVLAFMGTALLVGFLVYFLLASGDLFKRKLVRLSGERLSQRKVTVQVIDQIGERVAKSMLHLILASVLVGICTWLLLLYFGVQYPGLWGVAAGLLNCVPYLGPAVVAAGLLLASLLQFGDIATAAMVAGSSLVVTTLEGFLFTPIVFGRSVQLNPVAIFVSFLFWGWLWGIAGMLLALPLLMILKAIAESIEDLAPLCELLSD
jgi:predicted PurR-regulated permease PerM